MDLITRKAPHLEIIELMNWMLMMPSYCESKRILDQLGTTVTYTERKSAVVRIPYAQPVRLFVNGVGPRGSLVNECL